MDIVAPITRSLQDEHVIGIDPPLRPDVPEVWRRRINAFTGRAISDKALTAEQDMRAGLQRLQGLGMTAGIIDGLLLNADADAIGQLPDDAAFRLSPGLGLARSGEDISLGAGRQVMLGSLPVVLRVTDADALIGTPQPPAGGETETPLPSVPVDPPIASASPDGEPMATRLLPELPRTLSMTLGEMIAKPSAAGLPRVGIIVAQPVSATILGRPDDDCPPDPRDDPYSDLQRVDGMRLLLYVWPSEMVARVSGADYSLPPAGTALRNQLAFRVFEVERAFQRGEMHPWEAWGLPLALVGFDADWRLNFVDRGAVVRRGGAPLPRTAMVPRSGTPLLWQARLDQLVEHLVTLPDLEDATLRANLQRVPPVGVLPASCFDPVMRRQSFFPGGFGISAVPVPRSDLELALREAASLIPYNLSSPDRVELLIPVPDYAYEPGLLEIAEPDGRFDEAIAEFEADRARWIVRREQIRRRYDRLMEGVSGLAIAWPTLSMADAEITPPPAVAAPLNASRTRRFAAGSAVRTHSIETGATLTVATGDVLWMWVRIQSATALTGLSLRVAGPPTAAAGTVYDNGVYWGAADGLDIAAPTSAVAARRIGDLPPPGFWQKLVVPVDRAWATSGKGIAGLAIAGVEFSQRGGDVEYGPFGKDDASGNTVVWLADEAPGKAVFKVGSAVQAWPWSDVADRAPTTVPDYGTRVDGDARVSVAMQDFIDEWKQQPFVVNEIQQLGETGIDAYLDDVDARLKATNDAIDLGFVRARSDIYRVRQFMLGGDAASRLVTSPSLADLAIRDEGARATSQGISEFLASAVTKKPVGLTILTPPPAPAAGAGTTPTPTPTPTPPPAASGGFSLGTFNNVFATRAITPVFAAFNTPSFAIAAPAPVSRGFQAPSSIVAQPSLIQAQPAALAGLNFARFTEIAIPTSVSQLALNPRAYVPNDVRAQRPIAGLIERTISVAERLTPSPAVQALEYAIASKQAVLQTLRGLRGGTGGRPSGVAIDDLVVPGFALKAAETPAPTIARLFADLLKDEKVRDYVDLDVMIEPRDAAAGSTRPSDKHESDYFTAAVNAIDNAIALMRLVEGRVAQFEQLSDRAHELRDALIAQANAAAAELRAIDVEIEEARHDIATAEALYAEEVARVDALMARRTATLRDHVNIIAYRRVRECDNRSPAPTQETLSALAEPPVAACRREHPDTPPEIQAYVALLRDAPIKWFPAVAAAVARVDRIEDALAALKQSRDRAIYATQIQPRVLIAQADNSPKFLLSAQRATQAQAMTLAASRVQVAQLDLTAFARLSLLQLHTTVREASTLGDLIDGEHRNAQLTRAANTTLSGIGEIAACLHAEFAEVPPIVRLGWAEVLSEFDQPADLHLLGSLPDWASASRESRRSLQGLVDWLFGQIDRDNALASAMMNDLVRIALLLAAHAPVRKLIPARLLTDAPARIGSRLQLAVDVSKVRAGMLALVRNAQNQVVSKAIIEDIADARASARIIETTVGITTITSAMRIDLSAVATRVKR
jgi:hypothetical protein